MNLRMADSAGLVAFLHRIIGESGKKVLSVPDADVVRVGDAFFFYRDDPITVGAPSPPSVPWSVRRECVDIRPRGMAHRAIGRSRSSSGLAAFSCSTVPPPMPRISSTASRQHSTIEEG